MTMTTNRNHKNKAQHTTTATSHFSITGNEMSLTLTLHFLLLTQPSYLSVNHSSLNLSLFLDSPLFFWDLRAFRLLPFFRFTLYLLFQIVAKFGTQTTRAFPTHSVLCNEDLCSRLQPGVLGVEENRYRMRRKTIDFGCDTGFGWVCKCGNLVGN